MKKLIMVVDDEADILELVSIHLGKSGFNSLCFADVASFYESMKKNRPELIVLDLMLPDEDGLEVCKSLKKDETTADIPIIMLTARNDETDKILGLELGADDYVTKPFSPKELVARIKAILRRISPKEKSKRVDFRELSIDLGKYTVMLGEKKLNLTLTEFKILRLLASNVGVVFSRDEILDYLWGNEKAVIDRTIDVHIRNLREKLGPAATYVKNIRGIGYKLEE